ncbi:MAG: hypothetical protein RBU37_04100 [Myxococcota bacterium]|jgi:hypothetical protein|nr:hypothetical protein [Myxococcota bacterium]
MRHFFLYTLLVVLLISCRSEPSAPEPAPKAAAAASEAAPAADNAEPGEADAQPSAPETAALPDEADVAQADSPELESAAFSYLDDYSPLTEAQRAAFFASPADPPADRLDAIKEEHVGAHFMWTDELHHELFEPHIQGLGGGYVGIGTNQAYLYLGWQRPHLAWLIDYDPWVVALHEAYFVFFKAANNAEELLAFFEDGDAGKKILSNELATHPELSLILTAYSKSRSGVKYNLLRQRNGLRKLEVKSFLTDQETFDFVRGLILAGRVRTLLGNLLDQTGVQGIGKSATELGVPIRVLYLSNAEQYWNYTEQFKSNMLCLPFDEKTVVLRTSATKPVNKDYRYHVQAGDVFRAWLEHPKTTGVRNLAKRVRVDGPDHFPLVLDTERPE